MSDLRETRGASLSHNARCDQMLWLAISAVYEKYLRATKSIFLKLKYDSWEIRLHTIIYNVINLWSLR